MVFNGSFISSAMMPAGSPIVAVMQRAQHHFFTETDASSLHQLLDVPAAHFIEIDDAMPMAGVLSFIQEEYPQTTLSISTQTAFRQPVAEVFAAHLAALCEIPPLIVSDIKTCLQEAIMNSIIHGNLGIVPDTLQSDQFMSYLERVAAAISNPDLARKRISIYCWIQPKHVSICVSDQGNGFSVHQAPLCIDMPYGRGLPLIRAMSSRIWQRQPNHLTMQFALSGS